MSILYNYLLSLVPDNPFWEILFMIIFFIWAELFILGLYFLTVYLLDNAKGKDEQRKKPSKPLQYLIILGRFMLVTLVVSFLMLFWYLSNK